MADHPVGRFLRAGLNVGVNTDNRLMSTVLPSSELLAVSQAFELTWDEVERLTTNAVRSSFAPHDERDRILAESVTPWFAALPSARS